MFVMSASYAACFVAVIELSPIGMLISISAYSSSLVPYSTCMFAITAHLPSVLASDWAPTVIHVWDSVVFRRILSVFSSCLKPFSLPISSIAVMMSLKIFDGKLSKSNSVISLMCLIGCLLAVRIWLSFFLLIAYNLCG